MRILSVSNLPIYLPGDHAQVPFGDPIGGFAITLASPGVATVPGYVPANGDAIQLAIPAVGGGTIPAALAVATTYYVVGATPSAGTFNLAATKGGSAINTASASTGQVYAILKSGENYGTTTPFKPGYSVIVRGTPALVLQGANDVNYASGYGNGAAQLPPGGPSSWNTIATIPASGAIEAVLNYDWIRVSTSASVTLEQN